MYEGRIAIDPAIGHGKPIIKGIRVPVEIVLGTLAWGMEIDEITAEEWQNCCNRRPGF